MRVLSIYLAQLQTLTSDFFFTVLPQVIRLVILVIGVVTTSYRRLTACRRYMALIDRNSARFVAGKESGGDSRQCSICLGQIEEGEEGRRLSCEHSFHRNCLDPWLRSSGASGCPLCRRPVLPWEEVAEYELVQRVAAESAFEKELALVLLSGLSSGGCHLKIPTANYL